MEPTDEQELAAALFDTGRDLVINAGAGTGKTSTLEYMARQTRRSGRYLAFNKAIVLDAQQRMPMNVNASTVHSAAFREVGIRFKHRLNGPRQPGWRTAKELGIDPVSIQVEPGKFRVLQPGWLAGHVLRAAARFCQSADEVPRMEHFPYVDGIDMPDAMGRRTWGNNRELRKHLLPALQRAWDDLQNPNGALRYPHDAYVKLFALEAHQLGADFILHDEAQDANPVTLQILDAQKDAQIIAVGDQMQAIYGWRGAVDAMAEALEQGAESAWLTRSFRFGPDLADLANVILGHVGSEMTLVGTPSIPTRVESVPSPDAILCRTNAAAVNEVISLRERGVRPFLMGGAQDVVNFARAAIDLQEGRKTGHPELACFETWQQVLDYVAQDAEGDELSMLVNLLEKYGAQIVMDALAGMPAEEHADIVISTAHKAKGREWERVRLGPDFPEREGGLPVEELRLLYVACTRAQLALDVRACRPVVRMMGAAV